MSRTEDARTIAFFCNQKRITGSCADVSPSDLSDTIEKYLTTLLQQNRRVEVAFFGGSFTGIPMDEQSRLLSAAYEYVKKGLVDGIRLSTRPDYITREILDNLLRYGVTTIELGVQSMDDDVLRLSNRGHDSRQVGQAVSLIREYPFVLGLQMMTGLPGDTRERSVRTAEKIAHLKPDIVRIYPTLTIRDTMLEKMYRDGEYTPETLDEAVVTAKQALLIFEKNNIRVIRTGLQSTDEISPNGSVVAGPVHSAFGELVESSIFYDIIYDALLGLECEKADVYVAKKAVSKAVGNRRSNIIKIKQTTGIDIKIRAAENLTKREVKVVAAEKT